MLKERSNACTTVERVLELTQRHKKDVFVPSLFYASSTPSPSHLLSAQFGHHRQVFPDLLNGGLVRTDGALHPPYTRHRWLGWDVMSTVNGAIVGVKGFKNAQKALQESKV